jgi:predicted RecA/RadA family phage recombinase
MANANAGNGLIKEVLNVVPVVATAAVKQGDLIIFGPWFGVCLNSAAIGEDLSIDIEAGKELDLVSAASVAATVGAAVYYKPADGSFAAASAAGNALIGYTTKVKNSDNCFRIEKVRYATVA